MFQYGKRRKNPPKQRIASKGFPEGWNSLPHASSLKDTELAEFINGVYSQYGTLSKRQGCMFLGDAAANSTEAVAGGMFYDINGADYMLRITDSGLLERYSFTTNSWSLLTGTTPAGYVGTHPTFTNSSPVFDTTVHINMVQIQSKIYIASSIDSVVIFDGTAFSVYTELADPTGYATVAKTGSGTGTRSYYYRWVDMNEFGHTKGSPAVTVQASGTGWYGSMPAIDGSTYLTVTLPASPTGTTRRMLYRGDTSGAEFFLAELGASDTTYIDKDINPKGQTGVSTAFLIPDFNNTPGYHFYLMDVYKNSLVGVTVEEGKDVLVWSAGDDKFDSFALADGAGFDGYQKGDGQAINALQSFSIANNDGLFVFKDSRVGILQPDTEGGFNIQNVNVIRGTMSPHSPHVAGNNVRFYSSEGVASLGHEQNYGTILRYTVMSLKANAVTERVTPANLSEVASEYHKNLSIFAISTGEAGAGNDSMLVYDERYNTWSQWTGLHANFLFKAIHPTTKVESLYFGTSKAASKGGAIIEMFKGKTDYSTSSGSGNRITLSITTKQYDAGLPDKFKKYDKAIIVFGSLFGNGTTAQALYMDQKGLGQFPRYKITTNPTLSGFGNDEWGNQEVGMMQQDDQGETLNLRYINLRQQDKFWVKINLQNDGIEDDVTVIGIVLYYSPSERQLPGSARLRTLA